MGWTLFFMLVILKIPMIGACYLVWYAVREQPDAETEESPGSDKGPRRKPPPFPRWPRRGPVGGGAECDSEPCPRKAPHRRPAPVVARSRQAD